MFIAVEGVIGVGKTTLVRMLQDHLEAEILLEVFEENPFLSNFYGDRARYAFQTQMFFLLSRYHQQRRDVPAVLDQDLTLISDYTFAKDSIFAQINLAGDELDMYHRIHEALAEKIPNPDLLVYLQADTDVLMERIALRDRAYERNMERAYIEDLNQTYDAYFDRQHPMPVLKIGTNDLNIVRNPGDLLSIENKIRAALELQPLQPELPFSEITD